MAFSEFKTLANVQTRYAIKYQEQDFVVAQPVTPPESFQQEYEFNRHHFAIFSSEASRSEIVIFPLLREIYKPFAADFALWVQQPIASDDVLNGTPDYFVATRSELGLTVVGKPLVIVVEAKKNDFEQGWGQCLAELYAAQKINDDEDRPLYGIVTDGERWQFGKLLGRTFTKNVQSFSIDDLPELFGALQFIFESACDRAEDAVTK